MNPFIQSLSAYKNSHLIGLMGQSNAGGYNTVAPDTNQYLQQKGQYIFNAQYQLWEPLQQNYNNSGVPFGFLGYFGIELKLMQLMYDYYGSDQYMAKYAQGGTSLATDTSSLYFWAPGLVADYMYNGCVDNYQLAMANYPVQPMKMKVLIWIQGEDDTAPVDANAYQANFLNFITALKNSWNLPNLLVIQTGLSDNQTAYPTLQKNIINNAKQSYAINGNKYVSTDGADVQAGGVHFSSAGYEDIAQRVFDVLITML